MRSTKPDYDDEDGGSGYIPGTLPSPVARTRSHFHKYWGAYVVGAIIIAIILSN